MRYLSRLWALVRLGKFPSGKKGIVVGDVTLQTPTDGYTTADLTPSFNWTDATNATSYRIQIATDAAFTVVVETGTPATSDYTSSGLTAGQTYYWRVRGEAGAAYGDYSSGRAVKTLGTVTLDTPADASFTSDTTPTFAWNAATNATGYVAELATDSGFSNIIETYTGANTTFTATTIATDGWLYWRVRPTAESGAEVGSNTATRTLELFAFGYCLQFDGSNDYATVAHHTDFNAAISGVNRAFSVSTWVKFNSNFTAAFQPIVNKIHEASYSWLVTGRYASNYRGLGFYIYSINAANRLGINSQPTYHLFNSGTAYHIVCTWNGGTNNSDMKIYINGSSITVDNNNKGTFTVAGEPTNDLRFGNYSSVYGGMKQDEIAFYHKELSLTEVQSLYNSGSGRSANLVASADLKAYWKNNEGSGSTVADETGNGRTMTLAASPSTPSWTTW